MLLYFFLYLIALGLNICEIFILINIKNKHIAKKDISNSKESKRSHVKLAKASFESPLNPYDRYKDKSSNLYTARRQKGGIEIREDS